MTEEEIQNKLSEYCDVNYLKISKSDVGRIDDDDLDELLQVDGNYFNTTITSCELKRERKTCQDCGKSHVNQRILTINLKTKTRKCNICKIGDE